MTHAFCLAVAAACLTGAAFADGLVRPVPVNPVIAEYGENVLYYLSFDDGTADPDIGLATPVKLGVKIDDDGFFGKGLKSGTVRCGLQKGQEVVDFTRSGTALAWIRSNYDAKPATFEPALTYFIAHWSGEWKRLIGIRPSGSPWGCGSFAFFYELSSKGTRERASAGYSANAADWKAGTWRLVAHTWTIDRIGFSLDGQPFRTATYKTRLGPFAGEFTWCADSGDNPYFSIDECIVLDRLLSNDEIKAIYEKSLQVRNRK